MVKQTLFATTYGMNGSISHKNNRSSLETDIYRMLASCSDEFLTSIAYENGHMDALNEADTVDNETSISDYYSLMTIKMAEIINNRYKDAYMSGFLCGIGERGW